LVPNDILKVTDLSVSYGALKALDRINLDVKEGEIVALIGPNGAGKSTLLETILGLHSIENGRVGFMGQDITEKSTDKIVASGLCLVPEGRGILPLMTVLENLQLGAYHLRGDPKNYVQQIYKRFPVLRKRSKQLAQTMSGGEQQMLSIGRGLMSAPKLIMFDEPSLGLSPLLVQELFKTLVDINKEGYTVLVAEQNARKALQCAHRGYLFEKGRIVLYGYVEELTRDPRIQSAYLGGG
jgi:branched-chain amino acid transport system ATP-binding protein